MNEGYLKLLGKGKKERIIPKQPIGILVRLECYRSDKGKESAVNY